MIQDSCLFNSIQSSSINPINPSTKISLQDALLYKIGCNQLKPSQNHLFTFPPDSSMRLQSGKVVDLSHVSVDLSGIFIGGIGYGGGASRLMAQMMKDIGHEKEVYNLPYCIEAHSSPEERAFTVEIITHEDKVIEPHTIPSTIKENLANGFNYFNIPIALDGHASLASIYFQNGTAYIRFYDSLSNEDISYLDRYNQKFIQVIKTLIPSFIDTQHPHEVLHLLDQGGKDSSGCGYYTLHTAILLKERREIRNLSSYADAPLMDQSYDEVIRADLVVRSLLNRDLNQIDTSFSTLSSQRREHIYNRIGFAVKDLIKQFKQKS